MISPNSFDSWRLIDTIFITGISYQNIIKYIKNPRYSLQLCPDVLFSYPQKKETINSPILEVLILYFIAVVYFSMRDISGIHTSKNQISFYCIDE